MFVRPKIIDGKKRLYLVESYRVKTIRNPRQRFIAYVDQWPKEAVEKLKQLHKEYKKQLADSLWKGKDEHKTDIFMRRAKAKAGIILQQIADFERKMTIEVAPKREKVDRRRKGVIREPASEPNYYNKLFYLLDSRKLNDILSQLAKDELFGAVKGWPKERKERGQLQIAPFKKLLDQLWIDLQV